MNTPQVKSIAQSIAPLANTIITGISLILPFINPALTVLTIVWNAGKLAYNHHEGFKSLIDEKVALLKGWFNDDQEDQNAIYSEPNAIKTVDQGTQFPEKPRILIARPRNIKAADSCNSATLFFDTPETMASTCPQVAAAAA